jgi:hypothetical protein
MSSKINNAKRDVISDYRLSNFFDKITKKSLKKVIRVNKLSDDNTTKVFVDIRYFDKKKATKSGICLNPEEFNWLLEQFTANKSKVKFEKFGRELYVDWYGKSKRDYLITLKTTSKETFYKLDQKVLMELTKHSKKIQSDISSIGANLKRKHDWSDSKDKRSCHEVSMSSESDGMEFSDEIGSDIDESIDM